MLLWCLEAAGHSFGEGLPVGGRTDSLRLLWIGKVSALDQGSGTVLTTQHAHKASAPHPAVGRARGFHERTVQTNGSLKVLLIKSIVRKDLSNIVFVGSGEVRGHADG